MLKCSICGEPATFAPFPPSYMTAATGAQPAGLAYANYVDQPYCSTHCPRMGGSTSLSQVVWFPTANASPSSVPTSLAPIGDPAVTATTATGTFRLTGSTTPPPVTLSLDELDRIKREARAAALEEVQEFVVAHAFDTTVGRKIDDFVTALLEANKS